MVSKGDQFKCDVCGMVCSVDNLCGEPECDLICCGQPMKNIGRKKRVVRRRARSRRRPSRKR